MIREGFVDGIQDGVVRGWAFDAATGSSPRIEFAIDGRVVAEIEGTVFRPDLLAAGIGTGCHGFEWRLPDQGNGESPCVLMVRFAESGGLLRNGEFVIIGRGRVLRSELFGGALARGLWMPEEVDVRSQRLTLVGWAIAPFATPKPFLFTDNGVPFESVEIFERSDIAERFDLPAARVGFRCSTPICGPIAAHEIAFVDARTSKPFNRHHTVHLISNLAPVPSAAQRKRVGSSEDLDMYALVGSSAYTRLDRVLFEYFGRKIGNAGAVLDWGCGCGRVFRYLPPDCLDRFTGVDIDRDNIAWCRDNYPTAAFETVRPNPPTPLESGAFDLVFGISVFTHLTEKNHLEWLAELHRVTRPGGAILVSVHGETAWMLSGTSFERYAEWRERGYLVAGKNSDLDQADADTSLYFNSFVSRRYIYENWSRWFRVIDVLDGAIGNLQDVVVLERR